KFDYILDRQISNRQEIDEAVRCYENLPASVKAELIQEAILKNNLDLLKVLIQSPVDLNLKDASGNTPLISAILNNKTDIAIYLIEKGADLHLPGLYDQTPFMLTCDKKMKELYPYLINLDLDPNQKNALDIPHFFYACVSGHYPFVMKFLEQ